jgi:hypothetical protein
MRATLRQQRGQAAVEMALGTLVFVTILVFSIHFSEVGFLSLKVQEATAAAMWDTTQGKMHDIPWQYGTVASGAVSAAQGETQARYADFDGRLSTNNGGAITNVFTRASGMAINCNMGGINDGSFGGGFLTGFVYRTNGGMHCSAQANLSAYNFPTSFLENTGGPGGFTFKVKNYAASSTTIKVCGVGRAVAGNCSKRYKMLIDDWGLAGSGESAECPVLQQPFFVLPCPSSNVIHYWAAVDALYLEGSLLFVTQGASTAFAKGILNVGSVPSIPGIPLITGSNEDAYWMSLMGHNGIGGAYMNPLLFSWPLEGLPIFPTTPGSAFVWAPPNYHTSDGIRSGNGSCFLGQSCN